jgi:hypothetical protein
MVYIYYFELRELSLLLQEIITFFNKLFILYTYYSITIILYKRMQKREK